MDITQVPQLKIDDIGLKVGLEIHQQLATDKKLFCNCKPIEIDEYSKKFSRKLRTSKGELGEIDPAAIFENTKSKTIIYFANPKNSCLVEEDEEPPHDLDINAKNTALIIASALKSSIFGEIYVMRKTVIDGSNTSGFQRTMLISQGGYLDVEGKKIGIQSICLEEDAARLLKDNETIREYSLDRLGIPLVEIASEPISATPSEIRKVALTLGRLLRTTKKVTRGLGSIRQDVNVSIKNSGIVEVKGVQQLDQLEKVIEYEAKRQHGLMLISEKLKEKKTEKISQNNDVFDITDILKDCQSKIIQKSLKSGSRVRALRIKNFAGMFGYEPYEGIRLGKEIGQIVRFFGIGGVFHLDELPNYGIENSDVEKIKNLLNMSNQDGFLIIAGQDDKIDFAIDSIINRIESAKNGVPAETRMATSSGETIYLRPKPGASRMYPETDIPPIIVDNEQIEYAKKNIPKSWNESIAELQEKYHLNLQLTEQIFDSEYLGLFERICEDPKIFPTFVVSGLTSTITNLQRKGLDPKFLKESDILKTYQYHSENKIPNEAIDTIFEKIMSGNAKTVEEVMEKEKLGKIDEEELKEFCRTVAKSHLEIINSQGLRSIGPLMGIVMKELRGRADGETINKLLKEEIESILNNKN